MCAVIDKYGNVYSINANRYEKDDGEIKFYDGYHYIASVYTDNIAIFTVEPDKISRWNIWQK